MNNNNNDNHEQNAVFKCTTEHEYKHGMGNYISYVDRINALKAEIKKYEFECKNMQPHLLNYMTANNIEERQLSDGGKIQVKHTEEAKQLSLQHLQNILQAYFVQQGKHPDEAIPLMNFIKSHREVSVKDQLIRKYK